MVVHNFGAPKENTKGNAKKKSYAEASLRLFLQCLSCKAEEAGKIFIEIDPKNTSKKCCHCGRLAPKKLSERIHKCSFCGLKLDRDLNAAINIENAGLKDLGLSPRSLQDRSTIQKLIKFETISLLSFEEAKQALGMSELCGMLAKASIPIKAPENMEML